MTEEKLDTIQKNVNDKLDASLNRRLDESFEKVTTQLGQLYRSLGELNRMSADDAEKLIRTCQDIVGFLDDYEQAADKKLGV